MSGFLLHGFRSRMRVEDNFGADVLLRKTPLENKRLKTGGQSGNCVKRVYREPKTENEGRGDSAKIARAGCKFGTGSTCIKTIKAL